MRTWVEALVWAVIVAAGLTAVAWLSRPLFNLRVDAMVVSHE